MLFEEGVELLGCGLLVEEVLQMGWALGVYSLTPFPVCSLSFCFLCLVVMSSFSSEI